LAESGGMGFCWLSRGAPPERKIIAIVARASAHGEHGHDCLDFSGISPGFHRYVLGFCCYEKLFAAGEKAPTAKDIFAIGARSTPAFLPPKDFSFQSSAYVFRLPGSFSLPRFHSPLGRN